uniref:Cyclin-dependent kinases regulatory subunit n=1 Tax=Lygus hesperus TaxID=30085 RepID=A0A0A9ZIE1_LYGHE
MKYNKKERSILKEQVNPTGLLAKDSIMFILVCHAAPEFDILKNWDYAYGYLSMKNMVGQNLKSDYTKCEIEMTRIGSTEKIGTLYVTFGGLKLIKSIRDEDFECIEPRPGVLFQKLTLDKNVIEDTRIQDDESV